jgi:hypothetical protein
VSTDDVVIRLPLTTLRVEELNLTCNAVAADTGTEAAVGKAVERWGSMPVMESKAKDATVLLPVGADAQAAAATEHPAWNRLTHCSRAAVARYLRAATEAHTKAVQPTAARELLMGEIHAAGASLECMLDEVLQQGSKLRAEVAFRESHTAEFDVLRRKILEEKKRRHALEDVTRKAQAVVDTLARECCSDAFDTDEARLRFAVANARTRQAELSRQCARLGASQAEHDAGGSQRGVALQTELGRIRELIDHEQRRYAGLGGTDLSTVEALEGIVDAEDAIA